MNHILIAGHLGADPEVRFTSSGQKVTTLRVACNSRKAGKEETIWWKVTIWGEQFDKMIPYFKKGSSIMVTGEMTKPEIFTDKEGKPQLSMNIVANNLMFSPFGNKTEGRSNDQERVQNAPLADMQKMYANSPYAESAGFQPTSAMSGQGKEAAFIDDEIPF